MNSLERFMFKHVTGNVRRFFYEDPLIFRRADNYKAPSYEEPKGFVRLDKFPSIVVPVTLSAPEVEVLHGPNNRDEIIKEEFNYWKYDFFVDSLEDPRNLRGFFIDKTEDRNGSGAKLTTGYLTYITPTEFRSVNNKIRAQILDARFQTYRATDLT